MSSSNSNHVSIGWWSQNLSDAQKISRLLQFLEGNARKAVAGFEGTPGGVKKAMRLL